MNFFRNLLNKKTEQKPASNTVSSSSSKQDNTRLNYLLSIYGQHRSQENYTEVMNEILHGSSFLLIPTANNKNYDTGWHTANAGTTISIKSIVEMDGLKVLGAFSDEHSMLEWTKTITEYTAIPSQTVLDMCNEMQVDRIVINTGQKNMYILEKNRDLLQTLKVQEKTLIKIGSVLNPLSPSVINKIIANFDRIKIVAAAYQYSQEMEGQINTIIEVCLTVVSDNSRTALQNAILSSIEGEQLNGYFDVIVLEREEILNTVKNSPNSQFYPI